MGFQGVLFQSPSLRGSGRFASAAPYHPSLPRRFQSPSLRGSGRFPPPPKGGGRSVCMFQSPSLRGSGRFSRGGTSPDPIWIGFQSPSLRGSGRFLPRRGEGDPFAYRFNPLHCGAVVASAPPSPEGGRAIRLHIVSIPFIAGQWSLLHRRGGGDRPAPRRFNPLHCGAVVASPVHRSDGAVVGGVFQSPSLRGSGRFLVNALRRALPALGFNPLHCGAVVASPPRRTAGAGQEGSFNPLHCGAVVASTSSSRRRRAAPSCGFNPLHCGAVVASIGG